MRTTWSSPIRLWVAAQLQNSVGIELRSEDIPYYGVEGFINDNEIVSDSDRPVFDPPSFQLSNSCRQQLNNEISPAWTSSNFGIDLYLKALYIVKSSGAT